MRIGTSIALSQARPIANAPAEWTPADLGASLALWLDADDSSTITLDGSNVSQWDDKSGNGFHLSQSSAASQPLYEATGMNSKPALNNLTGRYMARGTTPMFRNVNGATIVAVYQATLPLAGGISNGMTMFVNSGGSGGPTRFALTTEPSPGTAGTYSVAGRRLDADSYATVSSSTSLTANPIIWMGNADYANAQANTWLDGAPDIVNAAFQTAGSTSNTDSLGIGLFSNVDGSLDTYDNTRMGEVLLINATMSTEDRQKLEGYLAWKWGLAENLPADHPYRVDGRLFGFGSFKALSPSGSDLFITSDGDVFIVQ